VKLWISCLSIFQRDFKPKGEVKRDLKRFLKKRIRQAEVIAIKHFEKKHFQLIVFAFQVKIKQSFFLPNFSHNTNMESARNLANP
jgi:hypothetical protein